LWDDETWHVLSARHLEVIRDSGALAVLPIALNCSERTSTEDEIRWLWLAGHAALDHANRRAPECR
jgi:hypothetical protein